MTPFWVGAIVYMLLEYALGKLEKPRANSVIECAENALKKIKHRKVKKDGR